MLIKQIIETFDVLDSSTVTGKDVENYLRGIKADADIEVYELKGPKEARTWLKCAFPGQERQMEAMRQPSAFWAALAESGQGLR